MYIYVHIYTYIFLFISYITLNKNKFYLELRLTRPETLFRLTVGRVGKVGKGGIYRRTNRGMVKWYFILWSYSYMILAPAAMANEPDPKKAAQKCFDEVGLDPDMYRIGHTKASCISRTKWIFFFAFFSVPLLSRRRIFFFFFFFVYLSQQSSRWEDRFYFIQSPSRQIGYRFSLFFSFFSFHLDESRGSLNSRYVSLKFYIDYS